MEKKIIIRIVVFSIINLITYSLFIYFLFVNFNLIMCIICIFLLNIFLYYISLESNKTVTVGYIVGYIFSTFVLIGVFGKTDIFINAIILLFNMGILYTLHKSKFELSSRKQFNSNIYFNSGKGVFAFVFSISLGLYIIYTNDNISINCKKLYQGATLLIDYTPNTVNLSSNDKKEMKKMIEKGLKTTVKQTIHYGIDYGIKHTGLGQTISNIGTNKENPQIVGTNINESGSYNIDTIMQDMLYNNPQIQQTLEENGLKPEDIDIGTIKKQMKLNNDNTNNTLSGNSNTIQQNNKIITPPGANNKSNMQDSIKNTILSQIPLNEKEQNKRICSIISESVQSMYKKPFVRYYSIVLTSLFIFIILKILLLCTSIVNIVLFGILKLLKIYQIKTQVENIDIIV